MLSASGVPLFAGIEPVDDLLITTMEELDKELVDVLTVNHPLFALYKENGWIEYKDTISPYVPVKLLDKPNSTVKDFTAYEDVDNTPQEALTEARFAYGHTVGTQMYNREELTKNQHNILDLVDVMQEQLTVSMTNHFGNKIMGTQDSDGRSVMGFGRIMAFNQPCGTIDPTQPGFAYWNPQQGLKPDGVTQYSLATEHRAGMRRLVRLCTYNQETPKVWLMGEDLYDATQAYLENFVKINPEDLRTKQSAWEDFEMFKYNGRVYIYDQTMGAKDGWLINPKRTPIRIHSGTNFTFEDWQMMEAKVAKKRNCLLYASVYTKRRNANGYITYT